LETYCLVKNLSAGFASGTITRFNIYIYITLANKMEFIVKTTSN